MNAAADLCTLLRLTLAPVFAWQIGGRAPGLAALMVYAIAIATDFADGRLARAGGKISPRGRLFDHGADVLFLLPALVILGRAGRIPAALPPVVALTFGLYCVDGWRRGRSARAIRLAPSRSGTAAGLANYAVAGLAACAHAVAPGAGDHVVYAAAMAAIAVNLAAAFERVQGMLRTTALGSSIAPEPGCAAKGD